jgi:hypothetical protein
MVFCTTQNGEIIISVSPIAEGAEVYLNNSHIGNLDKNGICCLEDKNGDTTFNLHILILLILICVLFVTIVLVHKLISGLKTKKISPNFVLANILVIIIIVFLLLILHFVQVK